MPHHLSPFVSQHQSASDAGYRSSSDCASVCVRSRGGPRAADVRASLWHKHQLLLQIAAADGRADGNPDERDIIVSEVTVQSDGRSDRGPHHGSLTSNKASCVPSRWGVLCASWSQRPCVFPRLHSSLSKHTDSLRRVIASVCWWGISETGGWGRYVDARAHTLAPCSHAVV